MTLSGVASQASLFGSSVAAELTEEEAAVRVFLAAGGLVLLGVGLACMTVWWWRGTRPEPPALGPLEVMSERRWRSAGDSERRRMVEELRPEGAGGRDLVVAPVPIDLSELVRDVPNFDDLRDVSLESQRPAAPGVTVDPEALELAAAQAMAGGAPGPAGGEVADATDVPAGLSVAAGDETVAMVEPDAVVASGDAAVDAAVSAGAVDAAPPVSGAAVAPSGDATDATDATDAPDTSSESAAMDATVAQPRPFDLGHPVGRD